VYQKNIPDIFSYLEKALSDFHNFGIHVAEKVSSVASPAMGYWGTCPLDFQQLHFCSLCSKSESQLSKYYV